MTIEPLNDKSEMAPLNAMKIVWLGLFFYSGVLIYLAYNVIKPTAVQEAFPEIIFQVLAIVLLIWSHVLPKFLLKKQSKQQTDLQKLKSYFVPFILSMATSEAVVIFGFVLFMRTGLPAKLLPFALAGMLNMVLLFPRREKILGLTS